MVRVALRWAFQTGQIFPQMIALDNVVVAAIAPWIAGQWLAEQDVVAVGADTWGLDPNQSN